MEEALARSSHFLIRANDCGRKCDKHQRTEERSVSANDGWRKLHLVVDHGREEGAEVFDGLKDKNHVCSFIITSLGANNTSITVEVHWWYCRGTHVSHFELPVDVQQLIPDLRPQAVRYVHPGAGRTLLTSVLEGRADGSLHHALHMRRRVHEVEVLPAAL